MLAMMKPIDMQNKEKEQSYLQQLQHKQSPLTAGCYFFCMSY